MMLEQKQMEHKLVSFLVPYLFLATLASLIHDALPGFISFNAFFYIVVAFGGIFSLFLSFIFHTERVRSVAKYQSLALTAIAVYIILVVFKKDSFPDRLRLDVSQWIILVCLVIQWIWTGVFEHSFEEREILLKNIDGKDGTALYDAFREEGLLASYAHSSLKRISSSCVISALIVFFLTFFEFLGGVKTSIHSLLFIVLYFFLCLIVQTVLRIFSDEQYYAGIGLGRVFSLSSHRIQFAVVFLAISAIIALGISSNTALLPASIWLYLLSLLERLFSRKTIPATDFAPMSSPVQTVPQVLQNMGELNDGGIDLRWIFDVLKYIGLAGLVVGILYFLFGSFFKHEWKEFVRENKLSLYLRRFFSQLRDTLRRLFSFKKSEKLSIAQTSSRNEFSESLKARLQREKSHKKKQEIGRLTGRFLLVVDWGDAHGIAYQPSFAPAEYTAELTTVIPALTTDLHIVGMLFEQALYSASLLGKAEEEKFFNAVEAITSFDQNGADTGTSNTSII